MLIYQVDNRDSTLKGLRKRGWNLRGNDSKYLTLPSTGSTIPEATRSPYSKSSDRTFSESLKTKLPDTKLPRGTC